jgi:tetratricopeptide (TPR) repeat protein
MKKKYTYLVVIFLIVASFIAYGRILENGFINFDDNLYITENNHIKSGINPKNIKWTFSAVVSGNWHPLTMLSHTLDWSLFGANASGHHLVSLFLHIGAVVFLFLFLNKTTKNLWPSAFAAALFALHPLRVESVAWASERKDVLSMFFGMASIYTYAFYAESSKLSRYFLCLILFALSLMSKPMLVTLPFVLLLLDYWPLGRQKASTPVSVPVLVNKKAGTKNNKQRKADCTSEKKISTTLTNRSPIIRSLLWEKAPFILLTIVSSIVTVWAQNKGSLIASMEQLPFPARVANAIISYVSYLGKIFWPVDLAVFYPYEHSFPLWQILVSCFLMIGITITVIYAMKKLPFLFVGWFWYLGTLIPVIGLVQVGGQAMADRYTYLPSIGIAIMLAWGIPLLFPHEDMRKKILFPTGITALIILAVLTWRQCGYWKNSLDLFNHALRITRDNNQVHNNIGLALFEEGKTEEAIDHYNKAIRIKPDVLVYFNRGNAFSKLGQYQRAVEDLSRVIHWKPDYASAYSNRGVAYHELGQDQQAIKDYNEAIRQEPDNASAYSNRGVAYHKLGQDQQAIKDYNEAIRQEPDNASAYSNRGVTYLRQGNNKLGCSDAQKACALGKCRMLEAARVKGYCS